MFKLFISNNYNKNLYIKMTLIMTSNAEFQHTYDNICCGV